MNWGRAGAGVFAVGLAVGVGGIAMAKETATDRWVSCVLGEVHVQKHHGATADAARASAYKKCNRIKLPNSDEGEGASDYVNSQIDQIYAQ